MIFIFNSKGECLASTPSEVNQGNLGVNDVIIIAPFPSTAVITAAVQLPNKQLISPQYVDGEGGLSVDAEDDLKLTLLESFSEKLGLFGSPVNVWKLTLKRALTQLAGDLKLSFSVFSDGSILETDTVTLAVTKTVPTLSPTVTAEDLDGVAQLLAAMNVVKDSVDGNTARAEAAASYSESLLPQMVDVLHATEAAKQSAEDAKQSAEDAKQDASELVASAEEKLEGLISRTEAKNSFVAKYFGNIYPVVNKAIEKPEAAYTGYPLNNSSAQNRPISRYIYQESLGGKQQESIPIRELNSQNFEVGTTTSPYHPINANTLISRLGLSYDSKNYVIRLVYRVPQADGTSSGVILGTVDLPLESVVLNATYDDETKSIVLKLVNGNTTSIPVGELISGLVPKYELTEEELAADQYWVYAARDRAGKGLIQCESGRKANTIVYRGSDGYFKVYDPKEDRHPTSKKYVDDADATKVSINLECTNTGYPVGIYTIDSDGEPRTTPVSNNPNPRYIPVYNSYRRLKTETPGTDDDCANDCANKKYVDDGLATKKLYLHTVCFGGERYLDEDVYGWVTVKVLNTDPTNYSKDCGLDIDNYTADTPFTKEDFSFLSSNVVMVSGWYEGYDGAYRYTAADVQIVGDFVYVWIGEENSAMWKCSGIECLIDKVTEVM